ncbi:hypothetical protein DFH28DRAFT_1129711 [Melampsora americana]|nr:hypothetical protein DFH28DRAFT_1129711 [Melampsora americana]
MSDNNSDTSSNGEPLTKHKLAKKLTIATGLYPIQTKEQKKNDKKKKKNDKIEDDSKTLDKSKKDDSWDHFLGIN